MKTNATNVKVTVETNFGGSLVSGPLRKTGHTTCHEMAYTGAVSYTHLTLSNRMEKYNEKCVCLSEKITKRVKIRTNRE